MRAPANWGRVGAFIQFDTIKLFFPAVGAFVGDIYCAEVAEVANSSPRTSNQLCRLVDSKTSDKKDKKTRGAANVT